jgi:hypothetical protein
MLEIKISNLLQIYFNIKRNYLAGTTSPLFLFLHLFFNQNKHR